jgi:hypothetical protein
MVKPGRGRPRKRSSKPGKYRRPIERGLGPDGGGWSIAQAAAWSGMGEKSLRDMVKRKLAGEQFSCFPFYQLGRRFLIPREGFKAWFNSSKE